MFLCFRWGTGSDRTVCVCVCVCGSATLTACVERWRMSESGLRVIRPGMVPLGLLLYLAALIFPPVYSAHLLSPEPTGQTLHLTFSITHTRKPGNIREFLMPGKVWNFTYKCCFQTFSLESVRFLSFFL